MGGDTIVLYPAPGIGHLISMVELGKLVLRHRRFSAIHILITTGFNDSASTDAYLLQISKTILSITFHRFPFLHAKPSPFISFAAAAFNFIRLNAVNVHDALQEISRETTIHAIVIDFFCASAVPISESLGIPVYCFFTSGLAAVAAYLYLPTLHNQVGVESLKDLAATKLHIPGLPPLLAKHMPQPVCDKNDPAYFDILYFSHQLARNRGILVNSFDGLEPIAMKAITGGLCVPDSPTPPIFNIGPLIADDDSKAGEHESRNECLSWLDNQPDRSIVFLCFGSRGAFSSDQVKEIAKGLERSGQRFLWAVKKPPENGNSKEVDELGEVDVKGIMPEGFLDRTRGRGMVVESWVPQTAVLKHPAVGGFVTHCGWNSVLEAVVNGVPLVAWPLYAEQHLNRYALVEQMKIAIPVEQREEDGFVSADEVEKRIAELMDSDKNGGIRTRCDEMKRMAFHAGGEHGSSYTAMSNVLQIWLGN